MFFLRDRKKEKEKERHWWKNENQHVPVELQSIKTCDMSFVNKLNSVIIGKSRRYSGITHHAAV